MRVRVLSLTGIRFTVSLTSSKATVGELQDAVGCKLLLKNSRDGAVVLVSQGQQLTDEAACLVDFGVTNNSTVVFVVDRQKARAAPIQRKSAKRKASSLGTDGKDSSSSNKRIKSRLLGGLSASSSSSYGVNGSSEGDEDDIGSQRRRDLARLLSSASSSSSSSSTPIGSFFGSVRRGQDDSKNREEVGNSSDSEDSEANGGEDSEQEAERPCDCPNCSSARENGGKPTEDKIEQIVNMGFSRENAIRALVRNQNNVTLSVTSLVS